MGKMVLFGRGRCATNVANNNYSTRHHDFTIHNWAELDRLANSLGLSASYFASTPWGTRHSVTWLLL